MTTGYCTITTKSHMPRARTLARTLQEHMPGAELIVLLADRVDGAFDPVGEPFRMIGLDELDRQDEIRQMAFYYRQNEFCWALKPRLHAHMARRLGFDRWVFLDADMAVYHALDPLERALDRAEILLSPHLIHAGRLDSPQGRSIAKLESYMLYTGPINGGLVGMRSGAESARFIDWWQDRLRFYAFDRRPAQFGDQYWLGMVPGMFDGVSVLRHPGINTAYWNLFERQVTRDGGGGLQIDGEPLTIFHFAGFDPRDPGRVSAYAIPSGLGDYPEAVRDLARDYGRRLDADGQGDAESWGYAFSRFASGEPITPAMRTCYFNTLFAGASDAPAAPFEDYDWFRRRMRVQGARAAAAGLGRTVIRRVRKALNAEREFEVSPWRR